MFTDYEHSIEEHIFELKNQQRKDLEELQIIQDYYSGNITEQCAIERLERVRRSTVFVVPMKEEIPEIYERIEQSKIEERREKQRLREAFTSPPPLRHLRPEFLKPSNIISIFESSLTRTLQLNTNELTDAIMIIRIYYYDVFRDMVLNGFDYNGVHYRAYTASAGQIRCKKMVFIREDVYLRHEKTIMCGLSLDHINELGGCNTNKFLAYLALGNSATDLWPDFDIDKSIVVEDMETAVHGMVDYIDDKTYQITRQEMDIDIAHTDGCGMVLPRLTGGKNTMIRLPWVKGLIAAFPFDEFIREKSKADGWNYGLVKDIYGQVHDVLAEGIEVIFCKSQFKLWKYYESWEQYKQYYKEYGCTAGVCNWEEDYIDNASIGYQMLQTLTDLMDDELLKLSAQTRYQLEHICNDRRTMLKALGATKGNPHKSPAQECLLLYPELLQDKYYRELLRGLKQSTEKWAWGGKLSIYGKYLFLIPDLYAFCEFLFLGDKNPKGLLQDGEVYAALFPAAEKLDCLRSPHLYREHAVRHNVAGNEQCKRWFGERGIYTSCHDLISKILMFDK